MAYLQEGKNTFPFVISVYSVRDYFTRHYRKKIASHRGHKVHGVKKLWMKMKIAEKVIGLAIKVHLT
jgi:hypothetical protein